MSDLDKKDWHEAVPRDVVKFLREQGIDGGPLDHYAHTKCHACQDAADEIDRLRARAASLEAELARVKEQLADADRTIDFYKRGLNAAREAGKEQ